MSLRIRFKAALLVAAVAALAVPASAQAAIAFSGTMALNGAPVSASDGTGLILGQCDGVCIGPGGNPPSVCTDPTVCPPVYEHLQDTSGRLRLNLTVGTIFTNGNPPIVQAFQRLLGLNTIGLNPTTTYTIHTFFGDMQMTGSSPRFEAPVPSVFLRAENGMFGNTLGNGRTATRIVGSPVGQNFISVVDPQGTEVFREDFFFIRSGILGGPETPMVDVDVVGATQNFGTVEAGASQSANLTITNVSGVAAPMGVSSIAGFGAADFHITADTCSGTTLPGLGSKCFMTVAMTPTTTGPRSAVLNFAAPAGNRTSVNLAGTGVGATIAAPVPVATVETVPVLRISRALTAARVKLKAALRAGVRVTVTVPSGTSMVKAELVDVNVGARVARGLALASSHTISITLRSRTLHAGPYAVLIRASADGRAFGPAKRVNLKIS